MEAARDIVLGICSDTHGGALPRWQGMGISAALHAGDVYDAPSAMEDDRFPTQWAESLGVPVLAVRGNHDNQDHGRFFRVADDITGRLRKLLPGLWVAGIGFGPKLHFDLPGESDLQPQCNDLVRIARREVMPGESLILLTHYPPNLGELPCEEVPKHGTYRCVADLVEELRPIAVVQGHVHQWFGRQWRWEGMLIVSPGPQGEHILRISPDRNFAAATTVSAD
jgi:Icc-related predicted phosphoesterase